MAISSSLGIGSGMDINGIVGQLISAEGQPQFNAISRQETAAKAQVSGLGSLKSSLSTFQTAVRKLNDINLFKTHLATSSNEGIAKVTAGAGSIAGSHVVKVIDLAKAQKSVANTGFTGTSDVVGSGTMAFTVGGKISSLNINASNNTLAGIRDAINAGAKKQNSIAAAEFAGASDVVGTGTMTFSVGANTPFSLNVDSSNNTLAGLRDAINEATGNDGGVTASIIQVNNSTNTGTVSKLVLTAKDTGQANAFSVSVSGDAGLSRLDSSISTNYTGTAAQDAIEGVTASIINVDDGYKLVLTAKDTGTANAFSVAVTNDEGDDNDLVGLSRLASANLTDTAAEDASIEVDGQTVTRSSNVISDVLQGVTLDLQSAEPGTEVNINIKLDNAAIKQTITDFVTAYNTMSSATEKLGKFAGKDGGSNGALLGDSTLRNIRNDLRQQTSVPVSSASSAFNTLKSIGIDIDKSGVMSMDGSKLDKALVSNLSSVSDVFSSSDGIASRFNSKVMQYLQSGGALDTRQTSLNKQLKQLSDKRDSVQLRLDNLQKGMMKQFISMDISVGRFQSTGSFLSNQINQWG